MLPIPPFYAFLRLGSVTMIVLSCLFASPFSLDAVCLFYFKFKFKRNKILLCFQAVISSINRTYLGFINIHFHPKMEDIFIPWYHLELKNLAFLLSSVLSTVSLK